MIFNLMRNPHDPALERSHACSERRPPARRINDTESSRVGDRRSAAHPRRLEFFERYLTVWVFLCMVAGVLLGKLAPAFTASLSQLEFGHDSHVNVAIAVLIWLMIYPMMLKVDFTALGGIARKPKGLAVTLFVNWLVKPFSMAFLAWLFMQHVFSCVDRAGDGQKLHRRTHHPCRRALHRDGLRLELPHRRRSRSIRSCRWR